MFKHTLTIRRRVFDHFVGLMLKELIQLQIQKAYKHTYLFSIAHQMHLRT